MSLIPSIYRIYMCLCVGVQSSLLSQQFRMPINRRLDSLGLNADVPLRDGSRAVLEQPLDKGDVVAVFAAKKKKTAEILTISAVWSE